MMNKDLISRTLALMMTLNVMNDSEYANLMTMYYSEKLMGYHVSLVIEIDDLLDEGYAYDEIKEFIKTCDFKKNDPELTEQEAEYLRMEAYRLLDIRYKLYMDEKKQEKTKKHLF